MVLTPRPLLPQKALGRPLLFLQPERTLRLGLPKVSGENSSVWAREKKGRREGGQEKLKAREDKGR
jgi:hypothetical protein